MGAHLRMMNENFFSIHGVPESINISKKPLCQNFHLFSSFKIFSNFMPYSRDVRSTLHGLLYTKPNLSLWGFTMPKGFGIGQHIREKPGTSKFTRTFGHTVVSPSLPPSFRSRWVPNPITFLSEIRRRRLTTCPRYSTHNESQG